MILFWPVFIVLFVLGVLISPLYIFYGARKEAEFNKLIKFVCFISLKAGFINCKVTGLENIDKSENYIITANHKHFFDSILLLGLIPINFKIVAADAGFRLPLISAVYKTAGFIKTGVKMGFNDSVKLYEALKGKQSVLIYSYDIDLSGKPEFTQALVRFACETKTKLLPVYINGKTSLEIGKPLNSPAIGDLDASFLSLASKYKQRSNDNGRIGNQPGKR